ncbi:CoF synthetase, partial [bacterium]|nr:CoF synthetase [bacterium]
PELLDRWVRRLELNHDLMAIPRGQVLHISAGNVFVGAVDSLVSGIITKNVNLLKMSGSDPVFPILFVESLREADPENLIWKNQAVLQWKGGDSAIEKPLLNAGFTVVFWGGSEALKSVRSQIGLDSKLIENGPRYSFAIAEGGILKGEGAISAFEGLALDICRWDQQACSSPHVVYVIDNDKSSSFFLMDQLANRLEILSQELPLGLLEFDEKVEIRKVRELAIMAEINGKGRFLGPPRFDFSLVFEDDPAFKISCLNRTLFIKRVRSFDEIITQIFPISAYLQTVGILAPSPQKQIFEKKLLDAGAKRFTNWGGMSEGKDGAPHEGSFLLANLVNWVKIESMNFLKRLDLLRITKTF